MDRFIHWHYFLGAAKNFIDLNRSLFVLNRDYIKIILSSRLKI
jgi:hypothetical protein